MSMLIVKPGLSTSIQDSGRYGHRSSGVPLSGAMDVYSFMVANLLCGNEGGLPALETTLHGAQVLFERDLIVALTGGGSTPKIEAREVPKDRPVLIRSGSLLRFDPAQAGCRTYLAVAGGFVAIRDLGSCSTYETAGLGGKEGRRLRKGDRIETVEPDPLCRLIESSLNIDMGSFKYGSWGSRPLPGPMGSTASIRCMRGPEWEDFDEEARASFFSGEYTTSKDSNRMGIRLDGQTISVRPREEMVSTGVCEGTVQVSHGGSLVVLMTDAQTTGGYPRIGQVLAADIPFCAQLRPGETLRFKETGLPEAETALLDMHRSIKTLRNAIRERFRMLQ